MTEAVETTTLELRLIIDAPPALAFDDWMNREEKTQPLVTPAQERVKDSLRAADVVLFLCLWGGCR